MKQKKKISIRKYGGIREPRVISPKFFINFFLGDKTVDIKNILSIKIKYGRVFGFFHIIMWLSFFILSSYSIYKMFTIDHSFLHFIVMLPSALSIIWVLFSLTNNIIDIFKYKAIQICIKNEKKIILPIEDWIYLKDKSILLGFLEILKNINPQIKIKNSINFGKKIKILIILVCLGLFLTLGNIMLLPINLGIVGLLAILLFSIDIDFDKISEYIRKNFVKIVLIIIGIVAIGVASLFIIYKNNINNNEKKEKLLKETLISAIQNDECYVNAEFKKGQLIKRKNDFNVYKIIDTDEEIEIKEERSVIDGIYKIAIFKYYSKNNNEIISTEYHTSMIADSNSIYNDWMTITKYNIHYVYNFSTKKLMYFNIPNADLSKSYVSKPFKIGFYYKKDSNNANFGEINENLMDEIFKFLVSDNIEQKNEDNNYTYLKKISKYKSKYGWCFIIKGKAKSSEKDLYLMSIITNEMVSSYDYNGVVLSYTNGDDIVLSENESIDYFKKIVSEI